MSERKIPQLFKRLGKLQAAHPWHFLGIALLSLVPAVYAIVGAGGLGFKSSFSELLPENKDSVIEARRVSKRLAGASTLTVVAETLNGPNPEALKSFVNALVPRLIALGKNKVGAVDYGVKETRDFFAENSVLYADIEDLRKAHEEVIQRYDYEVAKARGDFVDEDDEPTPLKADAIEQKIRGKSNKEAEAIERYPDGYYMHKDGNFIAVLIRTPVSGKEAKAAFRAEVEQIVASINPKKFFCPALFHARAHGHGHGHDDPHRPYLDLWSDAFDHRPPEQFNGVSGQHHRWQWYQLRHHVHGALYRGAP